jgi:hypothetical protein
LLEYQELLYFMEEMLFEVSFGRMIQVRQGSQDHRRNFYECIGEVAR